MYILRSIYNSSPPSSPHGHLARSNGGMLPFRNNGNLKGAGGWREGGDTEMQTNTIKKRGKRRFDNVRMLC